MMFNRIVRGDGMRASRFHDYQGVVIDFEGLTYLPRCLASVIAFRLLSYRSEVPWLGYRAVRFIETILDQHSSVLEYGSGMSTLWFARRAGRVVSVETDKVWHSLILKKLDAARFEHVSCLLCPEDQVAQLNDSAIEDRSFDFVLVDGFSREVVMGAAVRKVKPGGYVYLDNSDVPYTEHQAAKRMLLEAAGIGAEVRIFRDFYPGQVGVSEGTLVRMPER